MYIKAFYNRAEKNDISGNFYLQIFSEDFDKNYRVIKQTKTLDARSGQVGFTDSWTRGKSPIPFSIECSKPLWLWIDTRYQPGQWAGHSGIGEFFPISTEKDKVTILCKDNKRIRQSIGGHPENDFKGSAGCIVFLNDTEERRSNLLETRNFLLDLHSMLNLDRIELIVV